MRTLTALALLLLLPTAASAQDLDLALSAMVRISGTRGGTPVRGSGFVVGLDRDRATIVTASHVIQGVQQIEVTFAADRTESFSTGVVFGMDVDNPRGLAVFQVRGALPAGVIPLSFETARLQRGEDVFLLGFPEMATEPLALRMSLAGPDGNFLQLDRPAGEGLSGAPVLRQGKVVGVVTAEDLRLTYAVKATVAQDAVIGWGGTLGTQSSTRVAGTATPTRSSPPVVKKCVPGEELRENGIIFVHICPGTFTMGSVRDYYIAGSDESPAHLVTLSEFWIGKTEITNRQYRLFRPNHQGEDNLPTTFVSWFDAKAACEHLGGRLPTEAEWEFAARAGSRTHWSFGDHKRRLAAYAWYEGNADGKPHPVGLKKPNAWGLSDIHGNVWEWVADWDATYPAATQSDPLGPATGKSRVLRGGAFDFQSEYLRSANRYSLQPETRGRNVGFRCALAPRRQP